MFTALGIYAESFEKPFLECTSEFMLLKTRLQEEHDRYLIYLDTSTRKSLIATAEKQLLKRHIPAILDKVVTATSFMIFLGVQSPPPFYFHLT
ncbi:Cullin [Arachis hypogaea]|nr:Cullin [Arachis hypogaea]